MGKIKGAVQIQIWTAKLCGSRQTWDSLPPATKVENTKWWWWYKFVHLFIRCILYSHIIIVNTTFSDWVHICFTVRHTCKCISFSCGTQPLFFNPLPWSHLWYNFKILLEHQLQYLEQTLKPYPQGPNKNLTLWPKLIFQICTKLLSTCFSSSTSTTVTTSTSFELPSSHARVTLIKFTKQEWVSESVS